MGSLKRIIHIVILLYTLFLYVYIHRLLIDSSKTLPRFSTHYIHIWCQVSPMVHYSLFSSLTSYLVFYVRPLNFVAVQGFWSANISNRDSACRIVQTYINTCNSLYNPTTINVQHSMVRSGVTNPNTCINDTTHKIVVNPYCNTWISNKSVIITQMCQVVSFGYVGITSGTLSSSRNLGPS